MDKVAEENMMVILKETRNIRKQSCKLCMGGDLWPTIPEAEAGGFPRAQGQPGLYNEL